MITEEEIEKINIAFSKNKRMSFIGIAVYEGFAIFFTYALFKLFPQPLPTIGLFTILSILFFIGIWRSFVEVYPPYKIYIRDEGIELPENKRRDFNIIKYEWIELVILNEMGGGGLYYDMFFTKDGKKYINRDFQRAIDDPVKFVTELRKRGIEVKILEPSLDYQAKHDFDWIAMKMRGREFVW